MLPGEKTDYLQKSSHYTESRLLMGEMTPAYSGEIASKRQREINENCIWSKTIAVLTAIGHEGRYFSKKKNEPRRKEYETRSTISKESNKMY